jgi:DNA-binding NarL/FixJ family response regulator
MLMSIPRVKWLEQDLESCQYYRNYKKYEEVRSPVEPRSVAARVERLLGQELTDREKKIDEMRHTMSSRMIATALNMHSSTVRDDIAKIRAKKGQL